MAEECPICLDPLDDARSVLTHPACTHRMHVTCALNLAQYDARCPVCRQASEELRERPAGGDGGGLTFILDMRRPALETWFENVEHVSDDDDDGGQRRRARSAYHARRRRAFADSPELRQLQSALAEKRAQFRQVRREYRRQVRAFNRRLKQAIGPEPP